MNEAEILAWLDARPNGASMREAAEHAGVSSKTMSGRMQVLRAGGDVLRCVDPENRSRARWYTQARGAALIARAHAEEEWAPVQRWLRVGEREHLPRGVA